MYVLAFDTSSPSDSCAIYGPQGKVVELLQEQSEKQSEFIIDMIDETIKQSGISKKDISSIGVATGPGSFTGARIGIATAIGLGQGWNIPVFGVNSFEVLSFNNKKMGVIVRKNKVFFYSNGLKVLEKEEFRSTFPNRELITFSEYKDSTPNLECWNDELTKASVIAKILLKDLKKVVEEINPLYFS